MDKEAAFVDYFYAKYQGRVALGVGYNQNLEEIFPFVFENNSGSSTGAVALARTSNGRTTVHIYHLAAFITKCGNGSDILQELCDQADRFSVVLSVSAIVMPNGIAQTMSDSHLSLWYGTFGFKGEAKMIRKPLEE